MPGGADVGLPPRLGRQAVPASGLVAVNADEMRANKARKAAEADRAMVIAVAGLVGWQEELVRRRRERNERTRERVRVAVEARRQGAQMPLFSEWTGSEL